ncbi:MAG: hypothetical protein ACRC26_04430 [Bacteroidales bacterium]
MTQTLYICPLHHLWNEIMAKIIIYKKKAVFCRSNDDLQKEVSANGFKLPDTFNIAEMSDIKFKHEGYPVLIREAMGNSLEEHVEKYQEVNEAKKKKSLKMGRERFFKRMAELQTVRIGKYECKISLSAKREVPLTVFASNGLDAYEECKRILLTENPEIEIPVVHSKYFSFNYIDETDEC